MRKTRYPFLQSVNDQEDVNGRFTLAEFLAISASALSQRGDAIARNQRVNRCAGTVSLQRRSLTYDINHLEESHASSREDQVRTRNRGSHEEDTDLRVILSSSASSPFPPSASSPLAIRLASLDSSASSARCSLRVTLPFRFPFLTTSPEFWQNVRRIAPPFRRLLLISREIDRRDFDRSSFLPVTRGL